MRSVVQRVSGGCNFGRHDGFGEPPGTARADTHRGRGPREAEERAFTLAETAEALTLRIIGGSGISSVKGIRNRLT